MFQEVKFTVLSPIKQSFKLFEFFSIGGIKKTKKTKFIIIILTFL